MRLFALFLLADSGALLLRSTPFQLAMEMEAQASPILADCLRQPFTNIAELWPTNRMLYINYKTSGLAHTLHSSFPKTANWQALSPARRLAHFKGYPRGAGELFANFETLNYAVSLLSKDWWPLLLERAVYEQAGESRYWVILETIRVAVQEGDWLQATLLVAATAWWLDHFQDATLETVLEHSQFPKLMKLAPSEDAFAMAWSRFEAFLSRGDSRINGMRLLLLGTSALLKPDTFDGGLLAGILTKEGEEEEEEVPISMVFELWLLLVSRKRYAEIPLLRGHVNRWLSRQRSTEGIAFCLGYRRRISKITQQAEWWPACLGPNLRAARWWLLEAWALSWRRAEEAGLKLQALMKENSGCFRLDLNSFSLTMECGVRVIGLLRTLLLQAACLRQPLSHLPTHSAWNLLFGPLTSLQADLLLHPWLIIRVQDLLPPYWITEEGRALDLLAACRRDSGFVCPFLSFVEEKQALVCLWLCQRRSDLHDNSEHELYPLLSLKPKQSH